MNGLFAQEKLCGKEVGVAVFLTHIVCVDLSDDILDCFAIAHVVFS
jgi:hypothetical protein